MGLSFPRNRNRTDWYETAGEWTYTSQVWNFNGSYLIISNTSDKIDSSIDDFFRTHEDCDDSVHTLPYADSSLDLVLKKVTKAGTFNGRYYTDDRIRYKKFHECVNFKWFPLSSYTYCPSPLSYDWAYWATKAQANANPSRPTVDLPLFLYEMREIPRMLLQLGNVLKLYEKHKDREKVYQLTKELGYGNSFAKVNLALQLGWKPLVSDLISLVGLTKSIQNRVRYLEDTMQGKKIRRSLGSTSDAGAVGSPTSQLGITYQVRRETTRTVWYVSKMVYISPNAFPQLSRNKDAERASLGLSRGVSPSTIWNAIPFSWLIDYFLNVGDFIEASDGRLRYRLQNLNLMQEIVQEEFTQTVDVLDERMSFSGMRRKTHQKGRYVIASPVPMIAFKPFLTGRQMSIIGSLALTGASSAYHLS
uniref:Maturation protein n=1 Tax=Wenling levi-like virus 1 TaxID=1923497 RepID=A0A1L3KIY6_9VIRU|nr:hypothetical protein [Wenling levi-like virus 1]